MLLHSSADGIRTWRDFVGIASMLLVLGTIGLRSSFILSTVVFLLKFDERNPGFAKPVVAKLEHEPNTFTSSRKDGSSQREVVFLYKLGNSGTTSISGIRWVPQTLCNTLPMQVAHDFSVRDNTTAQLPVWPSVSTTVGIIEWMCVTKHQPHVILCRLANGRPQKSEVEESSTQRKSRTPHQKICLKPQSQSQTPTQSSQISQILKLTESHFGQNHTRP